MASKLRASSKVLSALLAAPAVVLVACIVADPPPDPPKAAPHRPTIVHEAVWPPTSEMLLALPPNFVIPVDLVDPTSGFVFSFWIDYDPTMPGQPFQGGTKTPGLSDGGGFVDVTINTSSLDQPNSGFDRTRCHVFEFVVALAFNGSSQRTPDSNGGDSVVWFYDPSGDGKGCPVLDPNQDGSFPAVDAAPDRVAQDAGAE
jgi:hypothetical protein